MYKAKYSEDITQLILIYIVCSIKNLFNNKVIKQLYIQSN